ncbi:hypothetical protein DVH24_022241 [Malus domestica]|uniref:HAT C-terminal dimerisation domain-containing protein n=1 Tax=Malus domestica TaxID=3750 RepID=A0A498IU93_MALDO|nr:hypothetical protein DVH24_022241 [Malus domestica]
MALAPINAMKFALLPKVVINNTSGANAGALASFDPNNLVNLAQKLTETKRDRQYPLVYLLVKLTLILTVATASVEIVFSVMKIMKNPHLNKMG